MRRDSTTYAEAGFTDHVASKVGQADEADCDDMGADNAPGAYFPANPHQVDVWSFDGLDSSMVIGARESQGTFRVFIAETVSKAEAKELVALLQGDIAIPGRFRRQGGSSGQVRADRALCQRYCRI